MVLTSPIQTAALLDHSLMFLYGRTLSICGNSCVDQELEITTAFSKIQPRHLERALFEALGVVLTS